MMKPVVFLGDSRDRLRGFPEQARRDCGFQIDRLQRGLDPDDWKPMSTIGAGVREIRVRVSSGAFRVIYWLAWEARSMSCTRFRKRPSEQSIVTLLSLREDLWN